MQGPSEGVNRTIIEDNVKEGPSYAPSYLWRGFVKMKSAQKTRYHFRFLIVFF